MIPEAGVPCTASQIKSLHSLTMNSSRDFGSLLGVTPLRQVKSSLFFFGSSRDSTRNADMRVSPLGAHMKVPGCVAPPSAQMKEEPSE